MTSATGDTTSYTITHYSWEFQRLNHGLWSHQTYAGQTPDPCGTERSDLNPADFARQIAHAHPVSGPHRIVVWDRPGVGRHPVAVLTAH